MGGLFDWIIKLCQGVKVWAVVRPWEKGVRIRLGKTTTLLDAGWHIRIPIIDEVVIINTRLRISSVPCQTITMTDGKTVTIGGMIGFTIVDPLAAMLRLQQPENSCAALAMTALSEYILAHTTDSIDLAEMEMTACQSLDGDETMAGIKFEFVKIVDFAVVKTYRLLQEQWRPSTTPEYGDGPATTY